VLARRALLTLALVSACAPAVVPRRPRAPGVPSVPLVTLDGRPARLDHAVRGRVALVSLWATWCSSCQEELASLERLERHLRPQGATVVGVAVGEDPVAVARFLARQIAPRLELVDPRFRLADALGQSRVPATLVFDRAARIVFEGAALDRAALRALRGALAGTRPRRPLLVSRAGVPLGGSAPEPRELAPAE
jgi:thiol-disulfide isomerase/thioredoxin